jgi:hypothetical protein
MGIRTADSVHVQIRLHQPHHQRECVECLDTASAQPPQLLLACVSNLCRTVDVSRSNWLRCAVLCCATFCVCMRAQQKHPVSTAACANRLTCSVPLVAYVMPLISCRPPRRAARRSTSDESCNSTTEHGMTKADRSMWKLKHYLSVPHLSLLSMGTESATVSLRLLALQRGAE